MTLNKGRYGGGFGWRLADPYLDEHSPEVSALLDPISDLNIGVGVEPHNESFGS